MKFEYQYYYDAKVAIFLKKRCCYVLKILKISTMLRKFRIFAVFKHDITIWKN